ncbi:MAG TPA: protein kinase, partial [Acidimicrobiales bacterium]|nr:protein kinase [Acidimicrobiales bacterium]
VADIAEGLGVAHAAGVIHRDVKPGNIMCNGDVPTLVDFGIARRSDATTMTRGLVLGTASYLAPEQAQGLALSPAADVYALGCVLYELLTGAPPFDGDGPVALAFKHVHDTPSAPSEVEPTIPPAVDAVVVRCLSKTPSVRPADGAALAAELRRALTPDADATVAVATPVVVPGPATAVMPTPVTASAPAAVAAAAGAQWRIVAALAVAAVLALVAWLALSSGDDTVTVPEIIGVSSTDAIEALGDAGLQADVFEVDSDQPAGTVVMTGPGPNLEAEKGSMVQVAVSNGSQAAPPAAVDDGGAGAELEIDLSSEGERREPPGRAKKDKRDRGDDEDDD